KLGEQEFDLYLKEKAEQKIADVTKRIGAKTEKEELQELLEKDPGYVRAVYEACTHGHITKEKAIGLAISGVGEYRNHIMKENGKFFMILSKSRNNKILRIEAERRYLVNSTLHE